MVEEKNNAEVLGRQGRAGAPPVARQPQPAEEACRLHPLVGHVVDGHNAARLAVHAVAPVLGSQEGRH